MRLKREDYNKFTQLYFKQRWLVQKKNELEDLMELCGTRESKDLVLFLLENFYYLDDGILNMYLNDMAEYIVSETGFSEVTTQLLSLTFDDEADSSQKVLDYIKMPVAKLGWRAIKTVNVFHKVLKNYNQGKTQIVIIDEFIGSGRTLRGRIEFLKKNIKGEFELKCCFVAGLRQTLDSLESEGIEIFCPLKLEKGISGHFSGADLMNAENLMIDLELKLAQKINHKELFTYSFGYGGAEALYSMEGCNGNTPNSVFPIFWWIKDVNDKDRRTLLTRFEIGF